MEAHRVDPAWFTTLNWLLLSHAIVRTVRERDTRARKRKRPGRRSPNLLRQLPQRIYGGLVQLLYRRLQVNVVKTCVIEQEALRHRLSCAVSSRVSVDGPHYMRLSFYSARRRDVHLTRRYWDNDT